MSGSCLRVEWDRRVSGSARKGEITARVDQSASAMNGSVPRLERGANAMGAVPCFEQGTKHSWSRARITHTMLR